MGSALDSSWAQMPVVSRIIITGVLLAVIGLTTPMWASVRDGIYMPNQDSVSFGLFHYCSSKVCTSIHDNLVPGRDVPYWYHIIQVLHFLGCVSCAIPMFVIVSSKKGNRICMTPALHQMMVLFMLAGVTQQFTAIYTFTAYFEFTNFLYSDMLEVDFYGSYYCAIAGAIGNFFGTLVLFFDEGVTKPVYKPHNLLFKDFRFKKPEFVPVEKTEEAPQLFQEAKYTTTTGSINTFPSRKPYRNMMEQLYYENVRRKTLLDNAIAKRNSKKNK